MNTSDPLQLLQKGLRVTLGAANAVVESLQDGQKRQTNLEQLQRNPTQLAEEFAVKGEGLEQTARGLVEQLINQTPLSSSTTPPSNAAATNSAAPGAEPNRYQVELTELTQQLASLRRELEQGRQS